MHTKLAGMLSPTTFIWQKSNPATLIIQQQRFQ